MDLVFRIHFSAQVSRLVNYRQGAEQSDLILSVWWRSEPFLSVDFWVARSQEVGITYVGTPAPSHDPSTIRHTGVIVQAVTTLWGGKAEMLPFWQQIFLFAQHYFYLHYVSKLSLTSRTFSLYLATVCSSAAGKRLVTFYCPLLSENSPAFLEASGTILLL